MGNTHCGKCLTKESEMIAEIILGKDDDKSRSSQIISNDVHPILEEIGETKLSSYNDNYENNYLNRNSKENKIQNMKNKKDYNNEPKEYINNFVCYGKAKKRNIFQEIKNEFSSESNNQKIEVNVEKKKTDYNLGDKYYEEGDEIEIDPGKINLGDEGEEFDIGNFHENEDENENNFEMEEMEDNQNDNEFEEQNFEEGEEQQFNDEEQNNYEDFDGMEMQEGEENYEEPKYSNKRLSQDDDEHPEEEIDDNEENEIEENKKFEE